MWTIQQKMSDMSGIFDGLQPISDLGSGDSCYIPNFVNDQDDVFQLLKQEIEYFPREDIQFKCYNRVCTFKRDIVYFSDRERHTVRPVFRYGVINPPAPKDWTKTTELIRDLVSAKLGKYCNTAIVNRYVNNRDYIGPHKDKTIDLIDGSFIFSVSFGGTRELLLSNGKTKQRIMLKPGSVFVLGPKTNQKFKHSITKNKGDNTERISVTLRAVEHVECF